MTINLNSQLGPGTLTIGAAGAGQLNATSQVRACAVNPTENVTRTESKRVLSGEVLPASEVADYGFTLDVTYVQDRTPAGVTAYGYANMGQTKPFTYQPDNASAAKVTGSLRVKPIKFGGSVDESSPESDVSYVIIGTPVFTPSA